MPSLQAHRGYWINGAKQNTLAAIKAAADAGYEMTEFDVRLTSDEVVILFHDDSYQNRIISQMTYSELKALTEVTTLEELFTWVAQKNNFKLNIEIKSLEIISCKLERKICELIGKHYLENRVMISSFNPLSLIKMRFFCSEVYRALLLTFENRSGPSYVRYSYFINLICKPQMINLRYQDLSDFFIKLSEKLPVVLWTVNDVSIYLKYKNTIRGIISDSITPTQLKELSHVKIN